MITGKLNPTTVTVSGATTPVAAVQFPGFQRILDFTAAGSETSVSVSVNGDVDKEYYVELFLKEDTALRLNSDSGANYGAQLLYNQAGSIAAERNAGVTYFASFSGNVGRSSCRIFTPTNFVKAGFYSFNRYTGGALSTAWRFASVYTSTASTTSLTFSASAFSAGTRITVWARRSQ